MADRRLLAACLSASMCGVLLSAFFHSSWSGTNYYSDISSFWGRSWVALGQVPYAPGSFLEYPPVSGVLLYLARMVGGEFAGVSGGIYYGYYAAFCAISLAAAAVIGWSTWRLASKLGVSVNPAYFILPTMLIYSVYNFDLFNALFIVLSLQFFVEKRRGWSALFLGVALATKLVAIVLLPILFLEIEDVRERLRYVATAVVTAGVFFVPVALFNFGYFSQFLSFYSSWGLEDAWYIWIFQDQYSQIAKLFGLVLLLVLLARIYTLKMPIVQKGFLALSAYLLSSYIYAPQFNVMLIPLAAVLALTTPYFYTLEIFNALIILTWFTTPDPTHAGTLPQVMALLRSASLALVCLSIGAGTGHSVLGWFRARLGSQKSLDGFARASTFQEDVAPDRKA